MSPTRTVRFPQNNPGWSLQITVDGQETSQPAEGDIEVPPGATLQLQTRGDLEALRDVPTDLLTGLTAMELGAGQIGSLKGFTSLSSLLLQGDITDADVEPLAEDVLPHVTFLVVSSNSLAGTCFSGLEAHPDAVVSVWSSSLTGEGLAAVLQLRSKWTRTRAAVLSLELLGSIRELGAQDLMVGNSKVAVDALVGLVGRSPRLTSLSLVSEQEGAEVLDAETVMRLRRRRPDLTINGSWLPPQAVDRLAADEGSSLLLDTESGPAEPVELTTENFYALTCGDLPVLVDFTARWCGPCKQLAPTLHEITGELAGRLVVGTLDIDEQRSIAERYEISAIPALLVFRNGQPVARIGGREKQAMYAELAAVL
jgi:thioredoxin 1